MSNLRHVPAALPSAMEPGVYRIGNSVDPNAWQTFQKKTIYDSLIGIRTPNRLVRSLVAAPTAFLRLSYIII